VRSGTEWHRDLQGSDWWLWALPGVAELDDRCTGRRPKLRHPPASSAVHGQSGPTSEGARTLCLTGLNGGAVDRVCRLGTAVMLSGGPLGWAAVVTR
jgi:hypothetical protein